MNLERTVFLVVGVTAQSGKSSVARHLAARLGIPWINSSAVVAQHLERKLGLAPGAIAAARVVDHEAYRPALIAEADAMRAAGFPPGRACVESGYRVIDGLRAVSEVQAARAAASERGLASLVICIDRTGGVLNDNTDGPGLSAQADIVLHNHDSLAALEAEVDSLLEELTLRS